METYSPLILIKKKLIYYDKFKTSNSVIKNNFSPMLYINLNVF